MRVLGAGDNVIDQYVDLGKEFPGGNAVNVAVFASRMGVDSAYLGAIGNDAHGDLILASLQAESVDTSQVSRLPGRTASARVRLDGNDRVFVGSDRGVAMFAVTNAHLDIMTGYDVVHTAYTGPLGVRLSDFSRRVRVSYDFGAKFNLADAALRSMMSGLFLATFSVGDFLRAEAAGIAHRAAELTAANVLVTCGSHGAYLASGGRIYYQAAESIVPVDTLGAGDAFIATVLVGLAGGDDPARVLRMASLRAADTCMHHGAFGHGRDIDAAALAGVPAGQIDHPHSARKNIR